MGWAWIRAREGLRWLFRGTDFSKIEADIERLAAPLFSGTTARKARQIRRRVARALSWLPAERTEKFHDTMARAGHSLKDK